jgi:hypothetical protein
MAAIAANSPICSQVGAIVLRTMSAASANCRAPSSELPKLAQMCRPQCVARGPRTRALRVERAERHDHDCDGFERERDLVGDNRQQLFHSMFLGQLAQVSPGPADRTMQRKPKWHVDVSMGCAMRAAGR